MEVRHGNADLLCTNCHMLEKGGSLHTLSGKAWISTMSYRVCAQCHSGEYRDWQYRGAWQAHETLAWQA